MTLLLLTRPFPDSQRFLDAVERDCGPVNAVISPVMEVVPVSTELPSYDEVILTSANGAEQASALGVGAGTRAWCVGRRTADKAKEYGFEPVSADGNADDLIALVLGQNTGRLLHIRGEHARGQIAARLIAAGRPCKEVIAYRQHPCAPTEEALVALSGTEPVILPLFSPRSAMLIPAILQAPVHVIAMSAAVAAEVADLGVDTVSVADKPDFESMLAATCHRLNSV